MSKKKFILAKDHRVAEWSADLNGLREDEWIYVNRPEKLRGLDGMQVIYAYTAPENFIDEVAEYNPDRVVVVDAADFGGFPGEIRTLESDSIQSTHFSTHRAPIRLLKKSLNDKGLDVFFVGIQAVSTGLGEPLSSEVENTVNQLG